MTSIRSNKNGFSLIEVLLVLALIGIIVASMASKMGKNTNREMRQEIRYFAASLKDLRNKARMRNRTYRLVINLPENPREKQVYWIESTSKQFLVTYKPEELEDLEDARKEAEKEGQSDPSGFTVDSELSGSDPKKLPEGLYFDGVEIAAQQKEFTAGRIFIHFFPEGRVEEAAIHITDRNKLHWTLAIHPLTGRVDLITQNKKLKDLSN
jgi:general secretion pathway protein H